MAKARLIADEIGLFLGQGQERSRSDLAALAEAYAQLCRNANERLTQVADFLRRGLRTEAIYQAELAPDLLDMVRSLDMCCLKEWNGVCKQHGLEMAPPLLLELAEQLNHAYVMHEAVRAVAEQMRALALERAPIKDRVAAMRTLVAADSTQELVAEDLLTFEGVRLVEINDEAVAAETAEDGERLSELMAELSSSAWCHPDTEQVRRSVGGMVQKIISARVYAELEQMLPAIHEAEDAGDYEDCRELLRQWQQLLDDHQVPPFASLQEQIASAEAFVGRVRKRLAMEQEHRETLAALAEALEEDKPDVVLLRQLHQQAVGHELPLGEDLERRYGFVMAGIALAKKRRDRRMAALVLILVAAAGALVWFLIQRALLNERIEDWRAVIATAVADGKLAEAEDQWTRLEKEAPELTAYPVLIAQRSSLDEAWAREEERAEQFAYLMAQVAESGEEQPNKAALAAAEELAATSAEKLDVVQWQGRIEQAAQARQRQIDEAFRAEVTALAEAFAAVDVSQADQDIAAFEQALLDLQRRLGVLQANNQASDLVRGGLSPLWTQWRGWQEAAREVRRIQRQRALEEAEQAKQQQAEEHALQALGRTSGDPTALATALKEFAAMFPDSPHAVGFAAAAHEADDWAAVLAWDALVRDWDGEPALTAQTDIAARMAAVELYLQQHGDGAMAKDVRDYLSLLQKAQAALGEQSPWTKELPRVLTESPVMQLYSFATADGKTYYMVSADKLKEDPMGLTARVVVTADVNKEEIRRFKGATKADLLRPVGKSPQTAMAATLLERLLNYEAGRWDTFGYDLAETLVASAEVDPLLRVSLARTMVGYLVDSSWGGEEELEQLGRMLERGNIAQTAWLDPDDPTAKVQRPAAAGLLGNLTAFADIKEQVIQRREALLARLRLDLCGQGVALLTEAGWRLAAGPELAGKDAVLMLLAPMPNGSRRLQLRTVGELRDGVVYIEPERAGAVAEGKMVFLSGKN